MLLVVLQEVINLYECGMIIIFFQCIDLFLTSLDLHVVPFHLKYCRWFVIGCLPEVFFFCIIVKWLLSYIQFIDWFFTSLVNYFIAFHLNYCSTNVIGCLTKSDYFVYLFNDYYFWFSSLIYYMLSSTCVLLIFILINVARMLFTVFK